MVNASPLIVLAKAGFLDLLKGEDTSVLVPSAVAAEIRAHHADEAVRAIDGLPWLRVVESPATPPLILAWDLGSGESAVLAWAHSHPGSVAVLDDLDARRCAAALGIVVRGTLGLVLRARRRGSIPAARPVMERLRQVGLFLSDELVRKVLALIGE